MNGSVTKTLVSYCSHFWLMGGQRQKQLGNLKDWWQPGKPGPNELLG